MPGHSAIESGRSHRVGCHENADHGMAVDPREQTREIGHKHVHRRISVKGSGGVTATIVIFTRQGTVLMSIVPPFTWEAIMDPEQVDELISALELAKNDAKKMAIPRERLALGGKQTYPRAEPTALAARRSSS